MALPLMVFQEVDGLFMDVLGLLGLLHLGRAGLKAVSQVISQVHEVLL